MLVGGHLLVEVGDLFPRHEVAHRHRTELHLDGVDLGDVVLLAVGALVRAGPQLADDLDAVPGPLVAGDRHGSLAPDDHPMPLGALLALSGLVEPRLVGGDRDVAHGLALPRVAQLRVGAEVASDTDFVLVVEVAHCLTFRDWSA